MEQITVYKSNKNACCIPAASHNLSSSCARPVLPKHHTISEKVPKPTTYTTLYSDFWDCYSPCSSLSSFSSVSCIAFSTRCCARACFCFLLSPSMSASDASAFKAASPTSMNIFPMHSKACARCFRTFLGSCLSPKAYMTPPESVLSRWLEMRRSTVCMICSPGCRPSQLCSECPEHLMPTLHPA